MPRPDDRATADEHIGNPTAELSRHVGTHQYTTRRADGLDADLRSETRAVRDQAAERAQARDERSTLTEVGRLAQRYDQAAAQRDKLVNVIGRLISLPPEAVADAYEVDYGASPARLDSSRRTQEDERADGRRAVELAVTSAFPATDPGRVAHRRHAPASNARTWITSERRAFVRLSTRKRCAEAVLAALDCGPPPAPDAAEELSRSLTTYEDEHPTLYRQTIPDEYEPSASPNPLLDLVSAELRAQVGHGSQCGACWPADGCGACWVCRAADPDDYLARVVRAALAWRAAAPGVQLADAVDVLGEAVEALLAKSACTDPTRLEAS
ncbi:hypothetical protein [Micromonospora sp. NPDC023814]|uniref:hypothetical protein n=1 Tax=Micromonospora sp. NPDC023814 TaxID=3154596 RepID=UPI0034060620